MAHSLAKLEAIESLHLNYTNKTVSDYLSHLFPEDLEVPDDVDEAISLDVDFVWDAWKTGTVVALVLGAVLAVILNGLGVWMTVFSRNKCSGFDVLLMNICLVNLLSAILVTPWFLSFAWIFKIFWPFTGYCIPWLILREFLGVVEGFTQTALALHQLVFFIIFLRSTDLSERGRSWKQYGKYIPMIIPWILAIVFLSLFTLGYDSSRSADQICVNYDGRISGNVATTLLVMLVHLGTFWIPLTVSICAFLMLSFMLLCLRIKTASFNPFRKYDGVYTVTFITDTDRTLLLDRNPQDNAGVNPELPPSTPLPDDPPLTIVDDVLSCELSGRTLVTWMVVLGVDVVCVTGFEIFSAVRTGVEVEGVFAATLVLWALKLILDPIVVMGLVLLTVEYRARCVSNLQRIGARFKRGN